MYKFREIECSRCKHRFVYLTRNIGNRRRLYRRKGYNETLESTSCTKCKTELVILENSYIGINIEDTEIELIGVEYGI